jgi:hypothetical protein
MANLRPGENTLIFKLNFLKFRVTHFQPDPRRANAIKLINAVRNAITLCNNAIQLKRA